MKPLISVIMPVFNAELYVEEAVRSILDQTFRDFEFIIVDDGSTDRTPEILRTFTAPRIRLLFNERNEGNYPARNRGGRLAQGKYIAVMDADDVAYPNRLQTQYEYMETHSEVLALGAGTMFWPDWKIKMSDESIRAVLLLNNCFVHSSLFVRRETMIQLGGYDEQYVYAADYDLVTRIALQGRLEILDEPLVYYRWHDNQITTCKRKEQYIFAEKIRRHYCEAFIRCYLSSDLKKPEEVMLSHTRMAGVIALFVYARASGSVVYEQLADDVLECTIADLSIKTPLCLENGLLGVACGFCYLLESGFVTGDINEIFADIDRLLGDRMQQCTAIDLQLQKESEVYWKTRKHLDSVLHVC